jgi:hypothetical protein
LRTRRVLVVAANARSVYLTQDAFVVCCTGLGVPSLAKQFPLPISPGMVHGAPFLRIRFILYKNTVNKRKPWLPCFLREISPVCGRRTR